MSDKNETSDKNDTGDDIDEIIWYIQMYYTPILVYLGSIGNCLSMCVFFGTKLRRSSSSVYLGALAITDTGALMSFFINWLRFMKVSFFHLWGFCQFFVYLTTTCSFLSVWFIMAFTVERFIAVRYPLHRQSVCTVARARSVVIVLTICGMLFSAPVLWMSEPQTIHTSRGNVTYCPCLVKEWESFANIHNTIDTILTFVVPFVLIVVLNTLISRTIYKLARVQRDLTNSSYTNDGQSNTQSQRTGTSQTKITKMLLVVSSAFLCFNLPDYVMRFLVYIIYEKKGSSKEIILTQHITNTLFETNFGINFVLYCASGQNFRREIVHLFCRHWRKRSDTLSRTTNNGNQLVSEYKTSNGTNNRPRAVILKEPWEDFHELRVLSE